MKLKRTFLIIFTVLLSSFLLSACTSDNNSSDGENSTNNSSSQESDSVQGSVTVPDLTISMSELAESDGKDGNPCYVAVDGTVYQISGKSEWQNGEHITTSGISCGNDLSEEINSSPHGKSVLSGLKAVGTLE